MPGKEEEKEDRDTPIVPQGWERAQTREGIPYYINHVTQRTQWEHPVIKELFKELCSMDVIRSCFGAYRVASKLRTLQVITNLHKIEGRRVWLTLKDMGLDSGQMDELLYVEEVESLLSKLFGHKDTRMTTEDIETSTEITLSWIMKCYDSGRTGRILLRPLLGGLFILTSSSPVMKYKNLFKVYSGNTASMTYEILSLLLKELLMIVECIDEQDLFSTSDLPGTVASFKSIFPSNSGEIREVMFVAWMKREPQLLVWLPTLHRYVTSETVKHEAKCAVCKTYPIVGFRYRCIKCINTDLCQNCYWTQTGTRTHKAMHPIREYCMATTTTDDIKDFGSALRNKVTKRYRRRTSKTPFLKPIETSAEETHRQESKSFSDELHGRINNLVSRLSSDHAVVKSDEDNEPQYDRLRHDIPLQKEPIQTIEKQIQTISYQPIATSAEYREAGTMTPPIYSGSVVDIPEGPPVPRLLPTSTPMTGFSSLLTLDEWTLGASSVSEEDKLEQLTKILVNAIPETTDAMVPFNPVTDDTGKDLLECMREMDTAFTGLLKEFNESNTY